MIIKSGRWLLTGVILIGIPMLIWGYSPVINVWVALVAIVVGSLIQNDLMDEPANRENTWIATLSFLVAAVLLVGAFMLPKWHTGWGALIITIYLGLALGAIQRRFGLFGVHTLKED